MLRLSFNEKSLAEDVLLRANSIAENSKVIILDAENYLFMSENFFALSVLMKYFGGKIDLVYIDPPFNTMQDFYIYEDRANSVSSAKTRKAYSDKMTPEKFLSFLREHLIIIHELLSEKGSLYLHIDCKSGHYVKIILDEIFGAENFKNDIARIKSNPKNFYRRAWGNERDMILFYAKNSGLNIWNDIKSPLSASEITRRFPKIDSDGRRYTTIPLHAHGETSNGITGQAWRNIPVPSGRHWRTNPAEFDILDAEGHIEWSSTGNPRIKKYADEYEGMKIQNVWTFKDPQNPVYPTEKNHDMLKLIISQSSICADELGRRFIGIDSSEEAVKIMRERLQVKYMFINWTELR